MTKTVTCFGELLLRLTPPGAQLMVQADSLGMFVGGAEANVAAGLASLGHDVRFAGLVSDNALGRKALSALLAAAPSTETSAAFEPLAQPGAVAQNVANALAEASAVGVDRKEMVGPFVEGLLRLREQARAAGRWGEADEVRDLLAANGVVVEDGREGSAWKLAE